MTNPVQSNSTTHGGASGDTVTLGSQPTSGNAVVVCVSVINAVNGIVVASMTDNVAGSPNTFSPIKSTTLGNFCITETWWCPSVTPGSGTYAVTINYTSGSSEGSDTFVIVELSASGAVDQSQGSTGTASASTFTVTNPGVDTGTTDFVLGAITVASSSAPTLLTPTGYTSIYLNNGSGGASSFAYRNNASALTDAVTWNWTLASSAYSGTLVSFKSATAGPVLLGQICL
jgi:hypothetical protein